MSLVKRIACSGTINISLLGICYKLATGLIVPTSQEDWERKADAVLNSLATLQETCLTLSLPRPTIVGPELITWSAFAQ